MKLLCFAVMKSNFLGQVSCFSLKIQSLSSCPHRPHVAPASTAHCARIDRTLRLYRPHVVPASTARCARIPYLIVDTGLFEDVEMNLARKILIVR